MSSSFFQNYSVCRDNFFSDPNKIVKLSERQNYERNFFYPGLRTKNILSSPDSETKTFADYLANRLLTEIFPYVCNIDLLDIRFHKNDTYDNDTANIGWIHYDWSDLAGIIYLTHDEDNFETGTSIFNCKPDAVLPTVDPQVRKDFNLTCKVTEEYLIALKNNWGFFKETIKFGNQFNRVVAYDAKRFHRPNNFVTGNTCRLAVLFFIKGYEVSVPVINTMYKD
jgi:hypothetical protein